MHEWAPSGDGPVFGPPGASGADQWARLLLDEVASTTPAGVVRGVVARLEDLCRMATEQVELAGAAVALRSPGGGEATLVVTGAVARRWAQLEFDLGEGPAVDAFRLGRPVLVGDLTGAESQDWPGYAAAALGAGLCGVLALPLQVGASRLGVLSLFLGDERQLDAVGRLRVFALADLMTTLLLNAHHDGLMTGAASDTLSTVLESAVLFRSEVYQAQGALTVALGVGLPEALARLRAHAFATGRTLDDVAVDIVEGRLTLDPDRLDGPADPHPTEDVQP